MARRSRKAAANFGCVATVSARGIAKLQVNRFVDVSGRAEGDSEASHFLVDARFLSPDPKRLGPCAPVTGSSHEMAPRPEVTVDHRMCRQELLCLFSRFESLHLSLSSSRGSMRILCTIVQVPARPVSNIGQDRSLSDAIAA